MSRQRVRDIIGRGGQSIVELAIVLPLLLAILFGIVEFGRLWFYSNHLDNSVRATARYASVLGNNSTVLIQSKVDAYARNEISTYIPGKNGEIVFVNLSAFDTSGSPIDPTDVVSGDTVKVIVGYRFTVLSGSIIPFFSGNKVLYRTSSIRYE